MNATCFELGAIFKQQQRSLKTSFWYTTFVRCSHCCLFYFMWSIFTFWLSGSCFCYHVPM